MSDKETIEVALVTGSRVADRWPDTESPLLAGALGKLGITTELTDWYEDPGRDWSKFSAAIIRSTWDMYDGNNLPAFFKFLDQAGEQTKVYNPPELVRWNVDKPVYLQNLRDNGVPTVPTRVLHHTDPFDFPDNTFVIKPGYGNGARHTKRFEPHQQMEAHQLAHAIHELGMAVMVQPYLRAFEESGEKSLVFFNGEYAYATRKGAILKPNKDPSRLLPLSELHAEPEPYDPTAEEKYLAESTLASIPHPEPPLYARVDVVGSDSEPLLAELELIEPLLQLRLVPGAADTFARAIKEVMPH